jgi:RNA-directed DNA polymerase
VTHALRAATYHSGPERISWINKASGVGQRPIVLLNIEDRVVQRAIVLILQPLLDPLFDSRSLGYMPNLGHLHALAMAEQLTVTQRRRIWVTEDIEDAFLHG